MPAARQRTQIATLSCKQCAQRKRACNKQSPCQACVEAGLECEPVSRARLPRGRHTLSHGNGDSLRQRVAKLEHLLSAKIELGQDTTTSQRQDSIERSAMKEEMSGIRDLIDELMPGDAHEDVVESSPQLGHIASSLLLPSNNSLSEETDPLSLLTSSMIRTLLDVYSRRVDPLIKVIHMPALRHQVLSGVALTPAQRALNSAVMYCALETMDEADCDSMLHVSKSDLSEALRPTTEYLLSKAGLITSTELCALQAFIIYIIALRAQYGASREIWVLIAMAIRIGQSLRLDTGDTKAPPFEREMRSRTWHSLGVLDVQAVLDGGTHPPIAEFTPTTPKPLHIDDKDISPIDLSPSECSREFTDMTFSCITHELSKYMRKLLHVPKDTEGHPIVAETWESRGSVVHECAESMNRSYFPLCGNIDPLQQYTRAAGEGTLWAMELLVRRPIFRFRTAESLPKDDYNILQVASIVLQRTLLKAQNEAFKPWSWFFWSKWYALAVVLAELCEHTEGEEVETAWQATNASFEKCMATIRDSRLKVSLARLRERAQATRKSHEERSKYSAAKINQQDSCSMSFPSTPGIIMDHNGNDMDLSKDQDMTSWSSWEAFIYDLEVVDPLTTLNDSSLYINSF